MKLEVNNISTQIHTGGRDNLYGDMISEVREYLSVKKPGAFFAKKKNRFASDRKYFCTPKGKFPTGFLHHVIRFIRNEFPDVELEVFDERQNLIHFNDELDINVGHWDLRDNQVKVLESCMNYEDDFYWPRGIIDAATNAGKNSIIAAIHKNLPGSKTLMLLHNKDIKNQALEFFGEVFDVGEVHNNKLEIDKPFVIGMAKTVLNRAKSSVNVRRYLSKVNTLIVDESHRAGASDYSRLISYIDAGQRFLVSGTPLDMSDPIKKMTIIGLCGEVLSKITNQDLIEAGYSNDVEVFMYHNTVGVYDDGLGFQSAVDRCIKFSMSRVNIIIKYLREHPDRQVLISVDWIDHGNFVYEHLKKICNVRCLYGSSKDREQLIDGFKNQEYRVLITTLLQEGINAPIDTLIYLQGGMSKIPIKQYVGRVLRKAGNHEVSHVIDFFDDVMYLDKHSRARIRVYRSEGFRVNFQYESNRWGSPQTRSYE